MNLTTGYPYSLLTNGLPCNYPKLEKSIMTDVVIIGGGISGALTAYYLINSGVNSLLQSSISKGLSVYDRTRIIKIDYQKNSAKLITSAGCQIISKKVINAAGYEVVDFIKTKIVRLHSTYAIASEQMHSPIFKSKEKILLWNTKAPYLYLRTTPNNRILIGGRDEKYYNANKRDKLIKKKTKLLQKDFAKLFPQINFSPEFSWAGTFGVTKDSLPYIGSYKKTPHTYYALGFGGNGITFSVIAAKIIRDLLLKKQSKHQSLFSFNR